jgi:hypothetical protein
MERLRIDRSRDRFEHPMQARWLRRYLTYLEHAPAIPRPGGIAANLHQEVEAPSYVAQAIKRIVR